MVGIGLDFIVLALLLPFGHSFFFVVALSLDMVFFFVCLFFFDGFQHPPVDGCSTASCDFVPLQEMSACPSTLPA